MLIRFRVFTLAAALLARETLSREDVEAVLQGTKSTN